MTKTYKITRIESLSQLDICCICAIDQYNWGGNYRPKAFGQMGLLPDNQLAIHMWCQERNPATTCNQNQDPVYLDSALEFFLQFDGAEEYYNFEINSAGILLCQHGSSRKNRRPLPDNLQEELCCQRIKTPEDWHVILTLPLNLMTGAEITGFRFNFYKIKEGGENRHFASYTPIPCSEPDFHLPEFFAEAILALG